MIFRCLASFSRLVLSNCAHRLTQHLPHAHPPGRHPAELGGQCRPSPCQCIVDHKEPSPLAYSWSRSMNTWAAQSREEALCPAPFRNWALRGRILRNSLQLSAFFPFLRSHGQRLTFVEEINTNHCVCKASPYSIFSFKILSPPLPQFSSSLPDIFITGLWFGKLWVGKVQGQDVQSSIAHL